MTNILIKRLSKVVQMPRYETAGSSGMDIAAHIPQNIEILPGEKAIIPTGFSLSIPEGFEVQIRPRSGLAAKKGISVLNTPGTIDADYRGEIGVILVNLSNEIFTVNPGERIAQLVIAKYEQALWEPSDSLDETERGAGGFGSTGKE